jgi:F-type H+-transporting ATPase subunit b
MLINWFTVIAQIINFLILVWLLKRYLYKPILNAIDVREKQITKKIEDAEKKDADAKKEKEEFRKRNDTFDKERNDLMKKAVEETQTERSRLIEEAKKDALALREKLEKILKEDQEHIGEEIIRKTKNEVFAIARKALKELADSTLEAQMVNVFIKRLKSLDKDEEKKIIAAFKSSDKPIIVRSTFELTTAQHTEIKKSFKEELGHSSKIQFETIPELISGIEMNANGYKMAWSISEYLASLEKTIDEIINIKTKITKSNSEENKRKVLETNGAEDKEGSETDKKGVDKPVEKGVDNSEDKKVDNREEKKQSNQKIQN